MARYQYVCEACGHQDDVLLPMDGPKEPRPCPRCGGTFRRRFTPTPDLWVGPSGDLIRSPGREWVGGDAYDPARFRAENDTNGGRHRLSGKAQHPTVQSDGGPQGA